MKELNRRGFAAGLAGLPIATAASARPQGVIAGQSTWSESVMVLYFDEEVRNGFSFRLSRYPDRNETWAWVHILMDGELYGFTERRIPSTPERLEPGTPTAIYSAPGFDIRMTRLGPSNDMKALSFSAAIKGRHGPGGIDGEGDIPIALEGVFHPSALRGHSPEGRFERTGRFEATLGVGRKRTFLSGTGKAHEQTQTKPRFDKPFTYAMLWGQHTSLIGLLAPERSYGNVDLGNGDVAIKAMQVEPWSPVRKFAARLEGGGTITGQAETVRGYNVPVLGRLWRGRIVRAQVEGQRMVGMINDWRPEEQIYGL